MPPCLALWPLLPSWSRHQSHSGTTRTLICCCRCCRCRHVLMLTIMIIRIRIRIRISMRLLLLPVRTMPIFAFDGKTNSVRAIGYPASSTRRKSGVSATRRRNKTIIRTNDQRLSPRSRITADRPAISTIATAITITTPAWMIPNTVSRGRTTTNDLASGCRI